MSARCPPCWTSSRRWSSGCSTEQFKGKEKLTEPNLEALPHGPRLGAGEPRLPLGLTVRRADAVGDRIYVDGNNAAALGAVYGGATVCAWYPITPSTSLAEAFDRLLQALPHRAGDRQERYAIVQAEDELASIGIVIGAAWNGARAFTATSGPGISLMQEFLGLAYFAEIPAVIFDVQRAGPSTGMPTRTQQSDLLSRRLCQPWRHQACRAVPRRPERVLRVRRAAFDLADRLQTPVFVCSTSISA